MTHLMTMTLKAPSMGLSKTLRAFKQDEDGLAAVEFALLLPLLATFLLGTLSVTEGIWANSKVDHTANVLGNVVTQRTELLDDTSIDGLQGILGVAPNLVQPFPASDIAVRVTSVIACHQDGGGNAGTSNIEFRVLWSDNTGNLAALSHWSMMSQVPSDLVIAHNDTLVVTEVTYTHNPAIKMYESDLASFGMQEIAFHQPREGSRITWEGASDTENARNCT